MSARSMIVRPGAVPRMTPTTPVSRNAGMDVVAELSKTACDETRRFNLFEPQFGVAVDSASRRDHFMAQIFGNQNSGHTMSIRARSPQRPRAAARSTYIEARLFAFAALAW